ncbi:calmodulin-binding protein 60 B-like [Vigna umbellata]|uniref:calmodulin-binding protein 60 B-like n=1 Tax=Vigna umbellata TaxID=87088 RepID=UPI001F5E8C19|nr:calmodulin-binding protein 60 B-like [Vigna umbellata]
MSKLKARDNNPLEVALFDVESRSIVSDENDPLSSIKVEICVLNGEFGSDGSENWSKDEFKSKILRQRENKGQLLKGDTVIALKNGVGFIHNEFTDNSFWIRTGRFRLGAMVAKSNMNDALIIREGISKPFRVKDYRSKLNKKKDPTLSDEIWHFKHISKKGKIFELLSEDGIHTVGDFLKELETDPLSLEEVLRKKTLLG